MILSRHIDMEFNDEINEITSSQRTHKQRVDENTVIKPFKGLELYHIAMRSACNKLDSGYSIAETHTSTRCEAI